MTKSLDQTESITIFAVENMWNARRISRGSRWPFSAAYWTGSKQEIFMRMILTESSTTFTSEEDLDFQFLIIGSV